jgi:hypothetical protein
MMDLGYRLLRMGEFGDNIHHLGCVFVRCLRNKDDSIYPQGFVHVVHVSRLTLSSRNTGTGLSVVDILVD